MLARRTTNKNSVLQGSPLHHQNTRRNELSSTKQGVQVEDDKKGHGRDNSSQFHTFQAADQGAVGRLKRQGSASAKDKLTASPRGARVKNLAKEAIPEVPFKIEFKSTGITKENPREIRNRLEAASSKAT